MTLFIFEHGTRHGAAGDPPLLRLTVEASGKMVLEDVDEHDETSLRGEGQLTAAELGPIEELLDPARLETLGSSLGHGQAWCRLQYGGGRVMTIKHATPAGELSPDALKGVAKAARPILDALLSLFPLVSTDLAVESSKRRTINMPKTEQPIRAEGPHGRLLVRYHEDAGGDLWMKVFDSGVVEHRVGASEEGDGTPTGDPLLQIGTGRVAELFELVRRHLPKAAETDMASNAIWELYLKGGKRDIRKLPVDGSFQFSSKAQQAAVDEAFQAFAALYRREV
ncbi:MAG: hypothetical protein HOO96_21825 [Polyangiaceae bacterium]|nr:hypothetical protein [Polyangiaceae bacterium]